MDLKAPYLKDQVIAYIGNKRRLIALIERSIRSVCGDNTEGLKFLDLFSGSGIVARLAKQMQFEVYANDWEEFACILGRAYIGTDLSDIDRLFGSKTEFQDLLERINSLPPPSENEQYIAKYYASSCYDIDNADFRRERLFYTRDNGLNIDKIRNFIEREYPDSDEISKWKKDLLTGILLYEAATHTNTSGVFKAFHKGFGGHNRDALKRILTPIRLNMPPLIDSSFPVHIYREDANALVKSGRVDNVDIAYIDPPYNQHQYGSNYHMLNTITLWDKIPAPLDLDSRGVLKSKAAIRKDWIKTRSDYCYRESAEKAFSELIMSLSAKNILISYSTDGIIPFDIMKDICASKGKISIITNEYTKYRGGKQSNGRVNSNIEFIMTVETGAGNTFYSTASVNSVIKRKRLYLLFKNRFSGKKLDEKCIKKDNKYLYFRFNKKVYKLQHRYSFELYPDESLSSLDSAETDSLYSILSTSLCATREEELEEIFYRLREGGTESEEENIFFVRMIPDILRKLAHKKNREIFYYWLEKTRKLENNHREIYFLIHEKIGMIEKLAVKRFEN